MTPKYKDFLTKELPKQLNTLSASQAPNFGLMTAHHMVEHLVYITKVLMKRRGEPEAELNKRQLFFRQFIDNGCPFQYRPKEGATVNDLRTASIAEAIQLLEAATEKFYQLWDTNPEYKSYSPMIGEWDLAEMELFHNQHGQWHLHQFGLMEEYVPMTTNA